MRAYQPHSQQAALTNVDNVTQDQPNPRACSASVVTVFVGSAPHHATKKQQVSSVRFAGNASDDA
jgi:hypothetical protein